MRTTKFVILSQPRTGSTLLCSLLNSAPGVRCIIEPINVRTHNHHMKPLADFNRLIPNDIVQNNLQFALDTLFDSEVLPSEWNLSNKAGDVAAGFKIMAHQIHGLKSEAVFWEYLRDNNIMVVICYRYNILMQYVSDLITIATRQSACWNGQVITAKVNVDVSKLDFELNKILKQRKYLIDNAEKYGLSRCRIKYEDFKDNYTPVEDIYYWLTGNRRPLSTKLSKQNSDKLIDRVINYDELVKAIRQLGYGNLLEGV